MTVLLLTSDLMIASQVEGAARRSDVVLRTLPTSQQVEAYCAEQGARLVIVDLNTVGVDLDALVKNLKVGVDAAPVVVAFGPHVHESRLAAAREAGCDEVTSRGQFVAQMDAILARHAAAEHDGD